MSDDILRELKKCAQIAGVSRDPGITSAIEALALVPDSEARMRRAEKLLKYLSRMAMAAVAAGAEEHPFLPQPEPEEIPPGEVQVGILEDTLAGVPLSTLQTHVLVSGPTRKGKTFYIFSLLDQLIRLGIPVHIFDTQGDYADILPAMCPEVRVIRFQDFKRNPFEGQANLSQDEWLQHITNYIRECFYYRDGVVNLFRSICRRLKDATTELNSRTFIGEYWRTPRTVRREADYFQSLSRFVVAIGTEPYRCASGFDLEKLAALPVVFDLTTMANDWRLFFIADLVTWHQASRQYRRGRGVELVLVFDELSRFYSDEAAKRSDLGEPFILQMVRESGKKGISVVLADQCYSTFHRTVRTNCQTKVIFETIDGPSRLDIARDLQLDDEQREFLSEMSFGVAPQRRIVVQIPTCPKPMLLLVPHIEVPEAGGRTRGLQDLAWIPLPEVEPEPEKRPREEAIEYELLRYLAIIADNPFLKETDYDSKIKENHSRAKGTRLRTRLKELGLIEEYDVNLYLPGKQIKIVIPTDAGYELLDKHHIQYKVPQGNGGILHKFWQRTIAQKLQEDGWKTRIEQRLGTKQVDVGAINGQARVAYEVVMEGLEKELVNLERDLEEGWQLVVFCVDYEETRERLNALIPETEDRAQIRLLREFV